MRSIGLARPRVLAYKEIGMPPEQVREGSKLPTLSEAIDQSPLTRWHWTIFGVCMLVAMLDGWCCSRSFRQGRLQSARCR